MDLKQTHFFAAALMLIFNLSTSRHNNGKHFE